MRGWQTMCVVAVVVATAAVGHSRPLAAQILQYTELQHSRSEAGIPGSNVTGGWSWVDPHGKQHHIWYVADTGGFRAFGDVVPQATSLPMNVGIPVVVAIPLASIKEKTIESTRASQQDDKAGAEENPIPESSQGDQGKIMPIESAAMNVEPQESLPSVTNPTIDMKHEQDFDAKELEKATEQPQKAADGEAKEDVNTNTPASPVNIPTSTLEVVSEVPVLSSTQLTRSEATKEPMVVQPLLEENIRGSPKSLKPHESDSPDGMPIDHLSDNTFHSAKQNHVTPSDNNFVATIFNKLSTILGAPDDNMQKPLLHQEPQNGLENVDTLHPDQHSTSDFVLIDRFQAPTIPKPRVGTTLLVPQPVNVMGRTDPAVMGLHSSGRPSTSRPLTQTTRSLEPLGIHLLNLEPLPQRSNNSSRPVPRPVRVVGEPSLENFWRPAGLARTTTKPFMQPRPARDYEYNYDYYDYNDYRVDNTGGPVNPIHKTKTKTVRSNSDEYSLETDYSDSEENEDSSDSQ